MRRDFDPLNHLAALLRTLDPNMAGGMVDPASRQIQQFHFPPRALAAYSAACCLPQAQDDRPVDCVFRPVGIAQVASPDSISRGLLLHGNRLDESATISLQ